MARRAAESLVQVAVFGALRHALTYRVPKEMNVCPGQRVEVPLGTRRARGVVLEPVRKPPAGVAMRDVLRVLDAEPLLTPELIVLGTWIADYYLAPPGEVFRAMLPLRAETRRARVVTLSEAGTERLKELEGSLLDEARASAEYQILDDLRSRGPTPLEQLQKRFDASRAALDQLLAQGWIAVSQTERARAARPAFAVRLASGLLPEFGGRKLSPVAKRILEALAKESFEDHRDLLETARAQFPYLRRLRDAGLVELRESAGRQADFSGAWPAARGAPPELTPAQSAVLNDLRERFDSGRFGVTLLHGVTASGKTEIYLRLIAHALERGRSALMLVPEIGLTPAVEAQFRARFREGVGVLHSGLSESRRHAAWWRVRRGEAHVVLGTRSAIFAPLANLGVVIVDEEHDPSYKQQETPRYQGRDVAVMRARLENALAVLGSATPSLESAFNARQGKYHLARLEERALGQPLASVEIIDMREEFRQTLVQVPISRQLKQAIEAELEARQQTMILLNRRGYSWFLLCRACGQTERCVNCSISLTYHRREHRLMCHYCGYVTTVPTRCRACGSEYIHFVGEGTEKVEDKLAELFPNARVARLDRDVARKPEAYAKILSAFRRGEIDILVGTQLIAKGHDFPGVTLVGVVSVDAGLSLPDFRAAERTFQLLTQAAGRAGRGERPGRVLVQTFYPEHYAVRFAAEQNYELFYQKERRFRRLMHYPPSTALANVVAQDSTLQRAARLAAKLGRFLESPAVDLRAIKVLGPSPAPLARIESRYRIQFLLKSASRAQLNRLLRQLADFCERERLAPRSVLMDMDPVSLM